MADYSEILELFKKHEQEHVLAGWDKLFADQQEQLLDDCSRVDFAWLKARWNEYLAARETAAKPASIEPAPVVGLPKTDADRAAAAEATAIGEDLLRRGKVAAFLVAGGQGSRLGFDGPKGCYPVGPLSGKTLFQWHAEQILARSVRYAAAIPWYIMTSRDNDRDTRRFFEDHDYFGLNQRDVFFFQQEMVPCLDLYGKLMLSSPSTLAMNPNGHGGSLSGLRRSGALKNLKDRGIEVVSYFQVDNPLVTICDPLFLGWHAKTGSDMSCKVLEKSSPAERIGVACLRDGKPAVVEYIDLDEETMRRTDADGRLVFWAGSIAIHMIDVAFIDKVSDGMLPWHQSAKKVPFFAGNRLIKPDAENAVKFETFVFDALPHARRSLNLEVRRENEFAPLKNAEGIDSVESCRLLLSNHFSEWLALNGVSVPVAGIANGYPRAVVEISPLYSLDAAELGAKIKPEGVKLERYLLLG
jgi:UDP-N-acetylglucosamine/UDP-N-acetylgalactosamine diphosphorylase